ncbi:DUF2019 domain-containing protein [Aurantimonas sp. C2-6-R+9]|uniref:DUF2019 domain-containing protein n=1 Tax=unclassified Aurantimonas TaxID=2638230 RepID=UPI002E180508|nr:MULTISPECIES: DUF2019 domain-containing protein [unclassified Aurantimonas]MEC5289034.1 DUF2019 domain-containing protein [Aurantimonas sp. C2-3-R2]MEC5379391.1 DUF2019 domain-containing protein [Aurantimonas sp. C2-6-R+9]MEC5410144.1 DUF2019 domain-containing protein [Aurantimonas sp. C2-4-R8]
MRPINLTTASVADLVAYFAELGVAEDEAELRSAQATINRLVRRRFAVENELKARAGDQRRQLRRYFNYPNIQVQLNAATATLALFPAEARRKIEEIASWKVGSHSADAGMRLSNLDRGVFKPK